VDRLVQIFFQPPMAVARLGGSDIPLDAFEWSEDTAAHGGMQTVIRPAVSFQVQKDGSIHPYMPPNLRFKEDNGLIRPVAPFLELWASLQSSDDGSVYDKPVTIELLKERGLSLAHLWFRVTAANRKAQRRTMSAACSFIARVELRGDDHVLHDLLAISPHTRGEEPLVYFDRPIPLGRFQVIRPIDKHENVQGRNIDLSIVRIRFTPGKGQVYGPPDAISAPASPLQPGQMEPKASDYGRVHEIVPKENRILNPNTPWSQFIWGTGQWPDTLPMDSYDGANVGTNKSWGIIDDTCDALIECTLVGTGLRFQAIARVFSGPPDFAPDHRHFYSMADDLADRQLPPARVDETSYSDAWAEISDLFRRAFETGRLMNLDAARTRALEENLLWLAKFGVEHLPEAQLRPKINCESMTLKESMTLEDKPYIDKIPTLMLDPAPSLFSRLGPHAPLPYAEALPFIHQQMLEEPILIDFLRRRADHIRVLMRPPFASWSELSDHHPATEPNPRHRDPRVLRDRLHDMRMPPYMRDANFYPLSLTRRQYLELMAFLDLLEKTDSPGRATAPTGKGDVE
jgi:hypothetical protein